ncbi:hypothetical protein BGX27_002314 [Mortierella sp. AM989]|nr:hypothetical protein BGX27_002314 [Mortierella sp. AM989]
MKANSHRGLWLARTLAPLALLAAGAQSACVSLATSTTCPGFKQYSVDTSVAKLITDVYGIGINLTSFTDVASFDAAVLAAGGFYSSSTCTGYVPTTERIRYQDTLLCSIVAQEEASKKCTEQGYGVPDMCASTCTLYANALSAMITKNCPTDETSTKLLADLTANCDKKVSDWPSLQSDSVNCLNATINEPATCGFGTDKAAMCAFCANNASDACCSSVTTCVASTSSSIAPTTTAASITPPSPSSSNSNDNSKSGLSTAALGGIIGGGVVVLLILFALIICCIRRKGTSSNKNDNSNKLSRHISSSSTIKYNISAPKIQEEGFASSLGAAPIPMTALPSISNSGSSLGVPVVAVTPDRLSKASSVGDGKPSYCQALYPYQASMADELDLAAGDIVNVHRVFDDGWAVGVNMNTSNEGAFPVVCVMFVDEAALEDDFEDVNMHSMTPMGHREDDSKGSPRSSLPSRASSPVNLPRRHSSMIRDSTIIPGVNSPMTSSPLAAGNNNSGNNQRLQTPVRDTMMSDASSINRWWEGEGSK